MIICGVVFLAAVTVVWSGSQHPCSNTDYGKFPHPEECQLYYDCSKPVSDLPKVTEPNLFECKYPALFDADYRECRPFYKVKCKERRLIKYICDTLLFRNAHAHGQPCWVDHLDCTNLGNGKQGIPHKPDSPYYAICNGGRFVSQEMCDEVNGRYKIFDTNVNECVKPDDN